MPEYVTTKPKTVCIYCLWHDPGGRCGNPATFTPRWSVITGTDCTNVWRYCSDINDGNCPHFEPEEE